jgi:pteridine reductase
VQSKPSQPQGKAVLITGAAHRVGAVIARTLHAAGMRIILHYRSSQAMAKALADELNGQRPDSAAMLGADLLDLDQIEPLVEAAADAFGRLDVLVNNASTFYPTPVGEIDAAQWDDLIGTNLRAPLFLAQAAVPYLRLSRGCIVNIVDIHAERPLAEYPVYSIAKAGLAMLTKSMARELGPEIRCNGIAPGAILWPEASMSDAVKQTILSRTALKRRGDPTDIARAVRFFILDADYVSGQILAVDGGRSVTG